MKRLARRLSTLCSAVSLLACVAVCVLWVRGYFRLDDVQLCFAWQPAADQYNTRWLAVQSFRGTMRFGVVRNDFRLDDPSWAKEFRTQQPPGFTLHVNSQPSLDIFYQLGTPGFLAEHQFVASGNRQDEYWNLQVRPWVVCIALAVLPALWLVRRHRARRARQAALCARCGYDLRASPERCPECGVSVPLKNESDGAMA
jgi:hypothetical protein